MAINFPTSLDNFTNPSSGNTLDSPSHSLQHSDINDAVEALEAKLGIGASPAGSATSGQVLTAQGGGTALWATPSVAGLTQVVATSVAVGSGSGSVNANGAVTFSGASSISLNGCFSSNYDNYRILIRITASSAANAHRLRMRVSGTDDSGSNYFSAGSFQYFNSATLGGDNSNAIDHFPLGGGTSSSTSTGYFLELLSPNLTQKTIIAKQGVGENTTYSYHTQLTGVHNLTTAQDGFSVVTSTGTITGTIRVYGYRN